MPIEVDEEKAIISCQRGRLADFGYLYDLYAKKIYSFIYCKTFHKQDAEDLTAETFLKALDKIKKFDLQKGNFSSWLYQIARNNVVDHYRQKKSYFPVDDAWDIKDNSDIEKDVNLKEKIEKVKQYLEALSAEQREIIVLRVWQDLPYKEIAEITGKSEPAVKMAFSRAIKTLQKEMSLCLLLILFFPVLDSVERTLKVI